MNNTEKYTITNNKESVIEVAAPIDLILFVPGTTDPVNIKDLRHEANVVSYYGPPPEKVKYPEFSYMPTVKPDYLKRPWDNNPEEEQKEEKDAPNFMQEIKNLKETRFPYLAIDDKWFSWSGDNSPEAREVGGQQLLSLILRVYPGWRNKKVFIHLIGHSHGGNVINEFTKAIALYSDFPEQWSVKSITYLSTPFFTKLHQVNESKLHPNCKILNVYNEYDITQRFVADYSVTEVWKFIEKIKKEDGFIKAAKIFEKVDIEIFKKLKDSQINYHDRCKIWIMAIGIFTGLDSILDLLSDLLKNKQVLELKLARKLILNIKSWVINVKSELEDGLNKIYIEKNKDNSKWYEKSLSDYVPYRWTYNFLRDIDFIKDPNVSETKESSKDENLNPIDWINTFLDIKTGPNDSYLFGLFEQLLVGEIGMITDIDDTSNTPVNQFKKYKNNIIHENITVHDVYDKRGKKSDYDTFIDKLEGLVNLSDFINEIEKNSGNNNQNKQPCVREILFVLLTQLDTNGSIDKAYSFMHNLHKDVIIGITVGTIIFPKIAPVSIKLIPQKSIKQLISNLKIYKEQMAKVNYHLVADADLKNSDYTMDNVPGGIPYLAVISHSLSHTFMTENVKNNLTSTFGSPHKH